MKKVKLALINDWMHRNCRELELSIWNYLFYGCDKMKVVNALMYYQNKDGGFGKAVEPDNFNPNSVPYATLYVINILKKIEFFDMDHPIYQGIKKYLDSKEEWTFTIKSNDLYPHAPWFNYNEEYNKTESIGISLGMCSFIIEYYNESKKYNFVMNEVKRLIGLIDSNNIGDMGAFGYFSLIEALEKKSILGYDYKELKKIIIKKVNSTIQRDPKLWTSYGYRPSDCIKDENSELYIGNEEIVNVELDYLVDTLPINDVWPITWNWFDNMNKYLKEFHLDENWYKAIKAIEKVSFLKNFKRIE